MCYVLGMTSNQVIYLLFMTIMTAGCRMQCPLWCNKQSGDWSAAGDCVQVARGDAFCGATAAAAVE